METVRRHLKLLDGPARAIEYRDLVPRDDLPAVLEELRAALAPCGNAKARPLARRIAAQYPTFRPSDAWLDGAAGALAEAAPDIAARVAAELPRREEWPPSVGTIARAVADGMEPRRRMHALAAAMGWEHERRAAEAAERARIAAEKARLREKLRGRDPREVFGRKDDA